MNQHGIETVDNRWKGLYVAGGVSAFVQLACVLMTLVVVFILGGEPATPAEYFAVLQENRLIGILRMDLFSLLNVILFALTSFAIFAALRHKYGMYPALFTAFIFSGMVSAVSTNSAMSMIYLSDQYTMATTETECNLLLAAAEAVVAGDWWHSTGGFLGGLFLQGGMTLLLIAALKSGYFSRWTLYSGILANGLDFAHVLVGTVMPEVASLLLTTGGIFYLIWFPMLGRDLLRLAGVAGSAASEFV